MARTRIFGFAAVAIWVGVTAAPVFADGLTRFETSIKPQIPPGTFTYKGGKALGDNGFVLQDVIVTPPPPDPDKGDKADKPQPIEIKSITVEALDFDAVEKQQTPLFLKLRIDGIAAAGSAGGFDLKQLSGLDKLTAAFQLDYKLDPDKKTLTLNRLELNLEGLGRLETSVVLDGVSPDVATQPNSALDHSSLRTASLTYDDHSLLAKAMPIAAAMQGIDPKAMVALAIAFLDAARVGQGAAAQKAIDSLVAFVEDYQKPKGPLKIALNPPDSVSNADLSNAKTADDVIKVLGLAVSYAGTRSSTPAEPPAKDEAPEKKKD